MLAALEYVLPEWQRLDQSRIYNGKYSGRIHDRKYVLVDQGWKQRFSRHFNIKNLPH